MRVIYEPRGRAREYSPWALNYYNGCDHGCRYCYVPAIKKQTREEYGARVSARKDVIAHLIGDLKSGVNKQVLLSFAGDPYCKYNDGARLTTQVRCLFLIYKTPVAILTKGGKRSLQDLPIIEQFGPNIKVGATACLMDEAARVETEPGAAPTSERLDALRSFNDAGVRTWLSMEPVIEPRQSIEIIKQTRDYVDEYKLGKLNHQPDREAEIDWSSYLKDALDLLRGADKMIYVKKDLVEACPRVQLYDEERKLDATAIVGWTET